MVSVSIGGEEKRKNPDNTVEKVHKYVVEHKAVSGFTIGGLIVLFALRIIPISWLRLLPGWSGKAIIMAVLSQLVAFYPARKVYQRIKSLPVDVIFEVNASRNDKVRLYYFRRGRITEDFDIEGSPERWTTRKGRTAYGFREIDRDEKTATASYMGEMSDIEKYQAEKKIEQNRLENKKWALIGRKLYAQFDGLTDKVENEYFSQLARKGMEYGNMDAESVLEEVEKEIPELSKDEEDDQNDLDKILQEVDAEVSQKIEVEPGNGEESGEQ